MKSITDKFSEIVLTEGNGFIHKLVEAGAIPATGKIIIDVLHAKIQKINCPTTVFNIKETKAAYATTSGVREDHG